ncbi:MAG: hypothetical protein ABI040_01045 [Rhodoferax sp.]
MNNKFEFKISSKLQYTSKGLVVLHGNWLGGRVARGSIVSLVQGNEKYPLHILAVDLGEGPGKLALACGGAQASSQIAKKGDRLVGAEDGEFDELDATDALTSAMTEEQQDERWVSWRGRYLDALQLLASSVAQLSNKPAS